MTRFASRSLKTLLDLCALGAVLVVAFMLRFDWNVPHHELRRLVVILPYVIALQYGAMALFVVHRFSWRYVGLREVMRILYALGAATAVLLAVRVAAVPVRQAYVPARHAVIPMGVILIDFVLAFCAIVSLRMLRRLAAERAGKLERPERDIAPKRTLLIGAGQAGVQVAKEIESHPDLGLEPVGFADDNTVKVGTIIHGVPVLGTTEHMKDLCRRTGAEQALITIANAPGRDIRRIVKLCEEAEIPVKIIPGMHDIVGGRFNLSRVRDIAIEDLLGREQVSLDETAISAAVRNQVVLVTGAGGSIGAELCRQVCRYQPKRLVLVERAENNLFEIHRELAESFPAVLTVPLIGDVCDASRIRAVFHEYKPAMVFHAAAHKHVPMMEWNPGEAIKNNVFGTKRLADLADEFGVGHFVMISTDKAVNPASMMGVSKRFAEIYIQALSQRSKTRFLAVRFGNVLGSAGSVVPIFKDQIARGGPVRITHPDMKRYFMTIPEASQLVLQAATMGAGGEIYILDMGEPVKIVDLANDLIRLSGFKPGEDIEVQFTGMRPGEKLFEELSFEEERTDKTRHPKIFVGRLAPYAWTKVQGHLDVLERLADEGDSDELRAELARAVPEFRHDAPVSASTPQSSAPAPAILPMVPAMLSQPR